MDPTPSDDVAREPTGTAPDTGLVETEAKKSPTGPAGPAGATGPTGANGPISTTFVACPLLLWLGVSKQDLMPKSRDEAELARRP